MKRNQKGITLVALVVTIIVLLILAGVSLSLVAGSNGIMNRATRAVNASDIATAQEQAEVAIMEAENDYYDKLYVEDDNKATIAGVIATGYTSSSSAGGEFQKALIGGSIDNYAKATDDNSETYLSKFPSYVEGTKLECGASLIAVAETSQIIKNDDGTTSGGSKTGDAFETAKNYKETTTKVVFYLFMNDANDTVYTRCLNSDTDRGISMDTDWFLAYEEIK